MSGLATTDLALSHAGEPGERDFFEYVAESYRYFLAADDARCEEVDAAKAAHFEARAGSVRDDIDGLEKVRCGVCHNAMAEEGGGSNSRQQSRRGWHRVLSHLHCACGEQHERIMPYQTR